MLGTTGCRSGSANDKTQHATKRRLRQRIHPEVDWEKFLKLFTDKHSKTLHERHVKIIEKICEAYSDGLVVRDFENIQIIIEATHEFLLKGGQPALILVDPLAKLVRLAGGGSSPFLMKTTTEEYNSAEAVIKNITCVGKLLLSPFIRIQIAAAESITRFASLSTEREQVKIRKEKVPELDQGKPVLQIFCSSDSASLVSKSGAVGMAAEALINSYEENGVAIAAAEFAESSRSSSSSYHEDENGPRMLDDNGSSNVAIEVPETPPDFQWEPNLTLPVSKMGDRGSTLAIDGSENHDVDDGLEIDPIIRAVQLSLLRALAEFTSFPPSAEAVTSSGVLSILPNYMKGHMDDLLLLSAAQVVWNCLEHCQIPEPVSESPTAAELLSTESALINFKDILMRTLVEGFRTRDKELRNEIFVILTLISRHEGSHPLFLSTSLLSDVLLPYSIASSNRKGNENSPAANFVMTSSPADFEMIYLVLNLTFQVSWNEECLAVIDREKFLSSLLSFLLNDFSPPCRWNSQQLASVRLAALSILFHLAPRCPESYNYARGNTIALDFLRRIFSRELRRQDPSAPPESSGLHRSAEEIDEENGMQRGILRLLISTGALFRDEISNEGGIEVLLSLFKDRSIVGALRADAGLTLAILCNESPENCRLFAELGGIDDLVPCLVYDPDDPARRDDLLSATLCCIWGCVVKNHDFQLQFILSDGIDALLDLIDICPIHFRAAVLGLLSELANEPLVIEHISQWRSRNGRTNAVELLIQIWTDEEARLGLQSEVSDLMGVVVDPMHGLGTMAKSHLPENAVELDKGPEQDSEEAMMGILYPSRTEYKDDIDGPGGPSLAAGAPPPPGAPGRASSNLQRPVQNATSSACGSARGLGLGSPAYVFVHESEKVVAEKIWAKDNDVAHKARKNLSRTGQMSSTINLAATENLEESSMGLGTMMRIGKSAGGASGVMTTSAIDGLLCMDSRVKIFTIFNQIGFGNLEKISKLSVKQKVVLRLVKDFVKLRTGEVYREILDELSSEGIRPPTPDADALEDNIQSALNDGIHLKRDQDAYIGNEHHENVEREKSFLGATVDTMEKLLGRMKLDSTPQKQVQRAKELSEAKRLKIETLNVDKRRRASMFADNDQSHEIDVFANDDSDEEK